MNNARLGDLIRPAGRRAGSQSGLSVYSVTKHSGFVPSLEYFKKQVFSRDVESYKLVEPGDFAYATIHLDEGSIGIAPRRGLISPMYTVFRADDSLIEPAYLIRFLKSPRALTYYSQLGNGGVHRRKAISLEALGSVSIPLPPRAEQRRIAAIMDRADMLRVKRRQVLAHLDILSQSIFLDLFGDPTTWSEHWPMGTIGDFAADVSYGTSARSGFTGKWPILRMGNITDHGRVDTTDLKYANLTPEEIPKYTVRAGDLLFNRTNSAEKVGKAAVVRTHAPFGYAGYLIRVRFHDSSTAEFVSAYLASEHGRRTRRRLAKTAVNQANINASELRRIRIAHPPADLVRQFESRVMAIELQWDRAHQALAASNALFESIQARAFRGKS
ncbi:restriction endonuclease subunit S [Herbiconiux liukaitaii]|uniref:restriction endonuclease subunit S n=1 Tax=Herbiconiux liukaitaii TaxID=3342799 RepID=UPI0035B803CB